VAGGAEAEDPEPKGAAGALAGVEEADARSAR
jgi:hypothetical protein